MSGSGTTSLTDITFSNSTNSGANFAFATSMAPKAVAISRIAKVRDRNVVANGKLLFTSAATGTTGMIQNAGTGTISGNVSMERAIDPGYNSGVGFRHYSTPVNQPTIGSMGSGAYTPLVNGAYLYPSNASWAAVQPFPNIAYYNETLVPNTPTAGYNAFDYGWSSPASVDNALETTRGYSVHIDAAAKVTLTGVPNNGSRYSAFDVTRTGTNAEAGWNFLGNPFPSPLDITATIQSNVWDSVNFPEGVDPVVWFFRSTTYGYDSQGNPIFHNGDYQFINTTTGETGSAGTLAPSTIKTVFPVMQGFFVRKINATPLSFFFDDANRRTPTDPLDIEQFYRSANSGAQSTANAAEATRVAAPAATAAAKPTPRFVFDLIDNTTRLASAAAVNFRPGATAGADVGLDAVRPGDSPTNPTVFTRNTAGEPCAVNALPVLTGTVVLPLNLHVLKPGQVYTLDVSKNTLPVGTRVWLEDRQLGRTHELTAQQPAYAFTAEATAHDQRLFLRFRAPGTAAAAIATKMDLVVYPNPVTAAAGLDFNANALSGETATATLLDALGRIVATQTVAISEGLSAGRFNTAGIKPGIYLVRLAAANQVATQRVEIR